jgi:hypothetical protein
MDRLEKYGNGREIRERLAAIRGIFPTLNVDMIFNLPGQTLAMLDHDIDTLLGLDVDQVSFYPLMTAPTARHKMHKTMGQADESLRYPMYERVLDRLLPSYRASSAWCFTRGEGHVRRVHHRRGRLRGRRQRGVQLRGRLDVFDDLLAEPLLSPHRGRAERHHAAAHAPAQGAHALRLPGAPVWRRAEARVHRGPLRRGVLAADGAGARRDAAARRPRAAKRTACTSRAAACTAGCS